MIRRAILPLLAPLLFALSPASCAETRYLLQAGPGQLELYSKARALDDVLDDDDTDPRTRALIGEVKRIRSFATASGLAAQKHYSKFVDLERSAVVYFLAGSRPLAFEPKLWSFPLVGSFPYTGWFDYWEARSAREKLKADGWDVFVRPVRAYSTGGWLSDPLLSTMLTGGDDALRYLVNVIFHELTHSNFFVEDQATWNESFASFVGDQMADDYLVSRFGAASSEVALYRAELAEGAATLSVMGRAYAELEALYASAASDDEKRKKKGAILAKLRIDADLSYQPNNASLIGFKTYNSGQAELTALFAKCGRDWKRFFALTGALKGKDFKEPQLEALGPFVEALGQRGCVK